MTKYPFCSAVVCTLHRPAKLERCLNGLRHLDYPRYEAILVGNASGDENVEKLADAARVWHSQPEGGARRAIRSFFAGSSPPHPLALGTPQRGRSQSATIVVLQGLQAAARWLIRLSRLPRFHDVASAAVASPVRLLGSSHAPSLQMDAVKLLARMEHQHGLHTELRREAREEISAGETRAAAPGD